VAATTLCPPSLPVGVDRVEEEQHGDICAHLLQQCKVQTLHQVSVLHVTTQELGLLDQLSPLLCSRFIPVQQKQSQLQDRPSRADWEDKATPQAHVRLCRRPHSSVVGSCADQLRFLIVLVHTISPLLGSIPVLLSQLPLTLYLLLAQLCIIAGVGKTAQC